MVSGKISFLAIGMISAAVIHAVVLQIFSLTLPSKSFSSVTDMQFLGSILGMSQMNASGWAPPAVVSGDRVSFSSEIPKRSEQRYFEARRKGDKILLLDEEEKKVVKSIFPVKKKIVEKSADMLWDPPLPAVGFSPLKMDDAP